MSEGADAVNSYQGFGARPELLPLRDGVMDVSLMTPEAGAHIGAVTRGYPIPPVDESADSQFVGVTADGVLLPGLYPLQDEGVDTPRIVKAATNLLASLGRKERGLVVQEIESSAWRKWTNAFPMGEPHGLLLQNLSIEKRQGVLDVVQATLSDHGYQLARGVMKLNGDLGEFINQYPDTLTEWTYRFSIFGTPSIDEPWGWQLFGHHLDLNCLIVGRQMVFTPTFMGAEFHSNEVFGAERSSALDLVNSLTRHQLDDAVVYQRFSDTPEDQRGPVDGRHLGGASQDNRVIPYEGIRLDRLSSAQRSLFGDLVLAWNSRLPQAPAAQRTRQIEKHLDDTYFAWYGSQEPDHAFYYRVQSPVVMLEYDNHPGIFLDNDEPEPFHVHTIVRTPNGNDYGKDLLRQHLAGHTHGHSHSHSHDEADTHAGHHRHQKDVR